MMAVTVECPSCGQTLEPPEGMSGIRVTCPVCGCSFVVQDGPVMGVQDGTVGTGRGSWFLYTTRGERKGPVSEREIVQWIQEGRVTAEDMVWCPGMETWSCCQYVVPFSRHLPMGH